MDNLKKMTLLLTFSFILSSLFPLVIGIPPTGIIQSNETPADGYQFSTTETFNGTMCVEIEDTDGDGMYYEFRQG